jgi:hypothetical protein
MHILDVFKPRRRIPLVRRKSQSSILDTMADGVSSWDPWAEYPYTALDGRFPAASPTELRGSTSTPLVRLHRFRSIATDPAHSSASACVTHSGRRAPRYAPPTSWRHRPCSRARQHWNVVDHPHRTRRARTSGSAAASVAGSDDRDTISVHSDRTAQAPAVRRQPFSPTASDTASFAPGSAPTYIDHRLTVASTHIDHEAAPRPVSGTSVPVSVEREASGSHVRPAPVVPSLTGAPVRGPTQRSSHGSIHQPAARSRDVNRVGFPLFLFKMRLGEADPQDAQGRNASPTPSAMSSGITHTLDNGAKIHVRSGLLRDSRWRLTVRVRVCRSQRARRPSVAARPRGQQTRSGPARSTSSHRA